MASEKMLVPTSSHPWTEARFRSGQTEDDGGLFVAAMVPRTLRDEMNGRRFPPPWRADKIPGGYVVRDDNGQELAYIYARANEAEARQAKVCVFFCTLSTSADTCVTHETRVLPALVNRRSISSDGYQKGCWRSEKSLARKLGRNVGRPRRSNSRNFELPTIRELRKELR
jgi:hypothetical protein